MKVAARQDDLEVLEWLLQERLHSEMPLGDFLQVRCAIKNGTLMVLSQHPTGVVPEPQPTLAALQQALQSLQPQVAQSVQLELKLAHQNQPYATHSFMLQPPIQAGEQGRLGAPSGDRGERGAEGEESRQLKFPMPILIAVACAGFAACLSSVYLLTRPCVIGECEPIQTAQQMSQESATAARRAKSQQELAAAQQQLAEATVALQKIPQWSPSYQKAQQMSGTLSTQSATLNQALTALQKASAAQKNQNPPHTAQEWQAIQALWRSTIASLQAVPHNSAVYPLAQQKLPLFRASLKSVDRQLNIEQQATKKLTLALTTAEVATKRQSSAQSLQNWQQVKSTWQVVVNELASIPKNSTANKEAQQLLQTYRPKLAAVRDRTTSEQVSALAYNQAVRLANLAKLYEQQNQLAMAVTNWKHALNAANQVPTGTFYHIKAQPLIDPYTTALKQAEEKLIVVKILQKTRADLNRTCSGELRFCNYSLLNQGIIVQLTSDYQRALERIFMTAAAYGDSKTQAAVVGHYQSLQQALEAISYNATLPLQVYDSKGSPILIYNP